MMKRLLPIFLCLVILLSLPLSVSAKDDVQHFASIVVDDQAQLLTGTERAKLSSKAVQTDFPVTVVILTVSSLDGKSPKAYANDYYDSIETEENGILLLISMEYRDWYILTDGKVHDEISDSACEDIAQIILDDLSTGRYFHAFDTFIDTVPDYLNDRFTLIMALIALGIGIAAGGITILVMRSKMNTAKPQRTATDYVKSGSFHLNTHLDFFLYSRVTRTAKPKNTSSSGGGGGSRGGAGGKF